MYNNKVLFALIFSMACLCWLQNACATSNANHPQISIVIDDLGNNLYDSMQAVDLPGAVVCSVLPNTPYARLIATQAHLNHKNVIMHVPMQPVSPHRLGPGALTEGMDKIAIANTLQQDLQTVPYAIGMSNHEGSLLTQNNQYMNWIMQFDKGHHLFFFDSRTTAKTVGEATARIDHVPTIARNVFLDDVLTTSAVALQFHRLIELAKINGYAIAIGHPHPVTLNYLAKVLPELKAQGIELVSLSRLIAEENT